MVPLIITLTSFVLLFLVSDIVSNMREFHRHHLQFHDVVEYYVYKVPKILSEGLVPIGLMLATMYALANHARHHEVTAIRSAGISLWRMLIPYLGVGCVFSIGLFWLNEFGLPDADQKMNQIYRRYSDEQAESAGDLIRKIQFVNERDNREWIIGVFDMSENSLTNVTVNWKQKDGRIRMVQADSARWEGDAWLFKNANIKLLDPADRTRNPNQGAPVPGVRIPEFYETPEHIWSEFSVSQLSTHVATKRAAVSLGTLRDYFALHPDLPGAKRALLLTQFHARIAVPWTCLVVMLIAIPFAIPSGRSNVFVGATAGLALCFVFFILQRFGLAMGTGGHLPPWLAAWLPNLLFSLLGTILISRVR